MYVRAEKGFSTGCVTRCLCFSQLVIAALVNLNRNGFLLEVSLQGMSLPLDWKQTNILHNTRHLKASLETGPFYLLSTVLHTTDIYWLMQQQHPLWLNQNTTHKWNMQHNSSFPSRNGKERKTVEWLVKSVFCFFFCDRWHLSCFSQTSPSSSVHTSFSGRKWFIPCYRKSGSQARPLTLWG